MGKVTPMRKPVAKPAAEVEELDLDDLELDGLEELDDVDLEEETEPTPPAKKTPAKRAAKPKPAPKVEFSEVEETEDELDFEEEAEEAPALIEQNKKTRSYTRKTARDVAQDEETDMAEYLRGFAAGKYGVNLSREDAERVDATLKAAEQDHTGNLFAYLVGSGVTETASATVIKSPGVTQVVPKAPRATKTQTRAAAKVAPKKAAAKSSGDLDMKAVRAWAQGNGYELGDRGRIPAEIQDAYRAAN